MRRLQTANARRHARPSLLERFGQAPQPSTIARLDVKAENINIKYPLPFQPSPHHTLSGTPYRTPGRAWKTKTQRRGRKGAPGGPFRDAQIDLPRAAPCQDLHRSTPPPLTHRSGTSARAPSIGMFRITHARRTCFQLSFQIYNTHFDRLA